MRELIFKRVGKMHIATEGPYRFVLREAPKGSLWAWKAEIYEREGRRTPKWDGNFPAKSQAIDWLARYRVPEMKETVE